MWRDENLVPLSIALLLATPTFVFNGPGQRSRYTRFSANDGWWVHIFQPTSKGGLWAVLSQVSYCDTHASS